MIRHLFDVAKTYRECIVPERQVSSLVGRNEKGTYEALFEALHQTQVIRLEDAQASPTLRPRFIGVELQQTSSPTR